MRRGTRWGVGIASLMLCLAAGVHAQTPSRSARTSSNPVTAARALMDAGDLVRAAAGLEAEIARHPESADAHYVLGLVRERQRDLPGAVHAYETAIRHAP